MANAWATTAQKNAVLRYAPEREALAQLTREARENYNASVQGAETTGRLTQNAVDQAKPAVSDTYDRAANSTATAQSGLSAALAALGPAATGFKAAAAAQGTQGTEKLARERANAEGDLQVQSVAASQAPAFARTLATGQLSKSLSKIFSSAQGIAGQEGEATSSEVDRLEKEARSQALTERGQNITAQSDQEGHSLSRTGLAQKAQEHQEDLQVKREATGVAGAPKPLTSKENDEGASAINQIKLFAGKVGGGKASRAQRVAALTEGKPEQSYKEGTETIKEPARPAFKPDVLMSAALDLTEYGHLTTNTEHRLSQEGYNVERLGVPRSTPVGEGLRKVGAAVQQALPSL